MTALNPVFTIGDQLRETLLVHGTATRRDAAARAVELLQAVRIPDAAARADDYPHQLSGGMRQRVLIAMALACRPSLVIADEPTTALDVTIQAQILDLLREMKAALNLSLLLITHDLGVIAGNRRPRGRHVRRPHRRAGRGPRRVPAAATSLYARPAGVDARRRAGQRLRAIDGAVPMLGALPPGCAFNPRCPDRFDPCTGTPPGDYVTGAGHTAKCYLHAAR